LRIEPGHRGHVRPCRRAQLEEIDPAIGVDDKVGDEVGTRGLDQNVDAFRGARAALGVADDPANGVARGDGTGADELLALLQGDISDLARRCIDLIERATGEGIDLHGVDETISDGLHPRGGIGQVHAGGRIGGLRRCLAGREPLQLAGQRQGFRQLHDPHRSGRIGLQFCLRFDVVERDFGWLLQLSAAGKRGSGKQQCRNCAFTESRKAGFEESRLLHDPSSFDQLMELT
jgi:hypothetical protein